MPPINWKELYRLSRLWTTGRHKDFPIVEARKYWAAHGLVREPGPREAQLLAARARR